MNPVGVFKRGDFWWYRVGRKVRRSSRSTDINEAIAQRAIALSLHQRRLCSNGWREWVAGQREDSNSWLRRTHSHMRRKARLRGWGQCLTLEELTRLVLASDGKCALTGISFALRGAPRDPFSISIDRIDSAKGYVPGNVRVVLLAVNIAMSHWGESALMAIARALVGRELVSLPHTALNMDGHTGGGEK